MSPEQIAAAEDAVRGLLGDDVVRLLRPVHRPEHGPIIEMIDNLPWNMKGVEIVAADALKFLTDATQPGGLIDPKDDDADVPWAVVLTRSKSVPIIGSNMARTWFAHGMHLLFNDAEVSAVFASTAAYGIALFEDDMGHEHEVWRWMMTAAIETNHDDRPGLGLASFLRAAKLLTGSWGSR